MAERCADNDPYKDCPCGGQRGKPSCMFPDGVASEPAPGLVVSGTWTKEGDFMPSDGSPILRHDPEPVVEQPTDVLGELRAARTAWHEHFGVPVSAEYARFLSAVGALESELSSLRRERDEQPPKCECYIGETESLQNPVIRFCELHEKAAELWTDNASLRRELANRSTNELWYANERQKLEARVEELKAALKKKEEQHAVQTKNKDHEKVGEN